MAPGPPKDRPRSARAGLRLVSVRLGSFPWDRKGGSQKRTVFSTLEKSVFSNQKAQAHNPGSRPRSSNPPHPLNPLRGLRAVATTPAAAASSLASVIYMYILTHIYIYILEKRHNGSHVFGKGLDCICTYIYICI